MNSSLIFYDFALFFSGGSGDSDARLTPVIIDMHLQYLTSSIPFSNEDMVDLCYLNPLNCLNNGKCVVNTTSNTTYCQCDPCHLGAFCETEVWEQTQFDTNYVFLIISMIGLGLSILNNGLTLELCIRCRRIRSTNCGIFLIIYSILSLISSILFAAYRAQKYYPNPLLDNPEQEQIFYCDVSRIAYNTLVYLCIWLSACVAFERGLVVYFDNPMNANRWRSFVSIFVILTIAGGSAAPMLWYRCDWANISQLQTARAFFIWFYAVAGITVYVIATLLVLISFANRIGYYQIDNRSRTRTYFILLQRHLFVFVPPVVYTVCNIPFTILTNTDNPQHSLRQCGISTVEYIIEVLLEALAGIPVNITWLLFVYPSRVYMTEFYLNTWCGQCVAKILLIFRSPSHELN